MVFIYESFSPKPHIISTHTDNDNEKATVDISSFVQNCYLDWVYVPREFYTRKNITLDIVYSDDNGDDCHLNAETDADEIRFWEVVGEKERSVSIAPNAVWLTLKPTIHVTVPVLYLDLPWCVNKLPVPENFTRSMLR